MKQTSIWLYVLLVLLSGIALAAAVYTKDGSLMLMATGLVSSVFSVILHAIDPTAPVGNFRRPKQPNPPQEEQQKEKQQ